jgi:predicted choloylglycine hydrolase
MLFGTRRSLNERIVRLTKAFNADGYNVIKILNNFNRIGIMAEHKTATNYDTGKKKKAYYFEGSSYEMGYLLGILAESEISAMASDFTNNLISGFIADSIKEKRGIIQELLISILNRLSKDEFLRLPLEIKEEMQGICDGCKKRNPRSKVDMKHLFVLNAGIDVLCSVIYTGGFLLRGRPDLKPTDFNIPLMCNAFAIFGSATGNEYYFGRDFMFFTASVFQDTAAHIIYNPADSPGGKCLPFVSVTAPGMVGSISGMNTNGVGIGVDMSPAANCDPKNVGINSILLTRLCTQFAQNANHAVEIMKRAQRGVSWNYIVADGKNDKACIVEAGSSNTDPDFLAYVSDDFRELLPDNDFISTHKSAEYLDGLMVRWSDYEYPEKYLKFNNSLWQYYNKKKSVQKEIYADAFEGKGYINKTLVETRCPSTYYFAPQREALRNMIITTNHYIIPEMRLFAMYPWTSSVVGNKINDIQWRYDELNNQLLSTIQQERSIDYLAARKLIDYLAPYGKYPSYYAGNPTSGDGKEIRIEGCTSIFDLKKLSVESHYGYYCDEWVKISLPHYFDEQ